MKFRNVIISLGLAALMGVGVAAGLSTQREVAKASTTQNSTLYFAGTIDGVSHWDDRVQLWTNSENDNLGEYASVHLTKGDKFRFVKHATNWDQECGWSQLQTSEASKCFWNPSDDNNISVAVTGTYNFFINSSKLIYVTFGVDPSYSYVVSTTKNDYSKVHVYKGGESVTEWSSDPEVVSGGWDMTFTLGGNNYTNIYRVDDRFFGTDYWTTIKLHDASNETSAITLASGSRVYIEGAATTYASASNEYLAVAFLYDVASLRGAATYNTNNYAYSICKATQEQATALLGRYDAVGFAGAKAIVDAATMFTYDMTKAAGEDDSNKTNVAFTDIIATLRVIGANQNTGHLDNSLVQNQITTQLSSSLLSPQWH